MSAKKSKKDKPGSASQKKDEAPSEYDNMDNEMLREVVPRLRSQLEKGALDRNYAQLERDLVQSFYDITKSETEESDLIISAKEREIERIQSNHKSTLTTFTQKEKQLIYQELIKSKEIDRQEIHRLDRPLGISDAQQKDTLNNLADIKGKLVTQRQEIDSIHKEHIQEVKSQYEKELAQLSLHFDTELIELKARYDIRIQRVQDDEEVRRRVDVHEITERKNSHINELVSNHKKAFTKLKSYYESVDTKDKKAILVLHDDLKDAKTRLDGVKRTLTALKDEHSRIVGLSASEATLATKLQQQASQRNRSDISFKNARLRELDLKRKVSKTKENIIALEQEYECIHKEYTELTDTTTDILERTMTQSNKVNDSLERKLRSIENNIRGGIMTSSFDAHTSQSISNGTSIDTTLSSSLLYCHVSESYSAEDRLDVLTKIIEEDCYPSNINLINQSSHHVKSNIVTSSMKLSTIEEQPRSLIVKNRDDNEDNNDDDSDHLRFSDSTDSLSSHIHEPATLV